MASNLHESTVNLEFFESLFSISDSDPFKLLDTLEKAARSLATIDGFASDAIMLQGHVSKVLLVIAQHRELIENRYRHYSLKSVRQEKKLMNHVKSLSNA